MLSLNSCKRKIITTSSQLFFRMKYPVYSTIFLLLIVVMSCKNERYPGPLDPQEALESFQLREGFRIEVFAAEPQVLDPVSMIFDARGDAYVVEMPDYPFMPEHGHGQGRIRLLQDTDGDGRVDNSVIFADSLLEATSILPWKGGLIVTAAPDILYLKDTDGDFKADQREILFTGFFENNSEAQVTSLRFGIDNWIYAANNGQAGQVTFKRKPDAPALSTAGADFRFRLDRDAFELESGAGQFGQAFDDWGNKFITHNTLHIRQVLVPYRYLHRNPNMRTVSPLLNISDHELEMFQITPPPYWRAERTARRQQQYREQNLDRVEFAEDHFTGSSGGTVYDGDAFPPEYYGNVFTGDVAGNLVHRDVLLSVKDSPAIVARRDAGEKANEFLASTDPWFRPASFTVGPDGYLYVIDMYRQHIETPLSIPEDLKEDMDFLRGNDRGRIYRIRPAKDDASGQPVSNLKELPTGELLQLLSHPNRWYRRVAQRLLVERHDASAVPAAEVLVAEHNDPRTRLHALYVLEGLDALSAKTVGAALADAHPGVRKHALMLAERYPELGQRVLHATSDSVVQVAFQAALSAGQFSGPEVVRALAEVTLRHGTDRWIRTAVLSSQAGTSMPLINELQTRDFFRQPAQWKLQFVEDFAFAVGKENASAGVRQFLENLKKPAMAGDARWQAAAVKGFTEGLAKSEGITPALRKKLEALKTGTAAETSLAIEELTKLYARV